MPLGARKTPAQKRGATSRALARFLVAATTTKGGATWLSDGVLPPTLRFRAFVVPDTQFLSACCPLLDVTSAPGTPPPSHHLHFVVVVVYFQSQEEETSDRNDWPGAFLDPTFTGSNCLPIVRFQSDFARDIHYYKSFLAVHY